MWLSFCWCFARNTPSACCLVFLQLQEYMALQIGNMKGEKILWVHHNSCYQWQRIDFSFFLISYTFSNFHCLYASLAILHFLSIQCTWHTSVISSLSFMSCPKDMVCSRDMNSKHGRERVLHNEIHTGIAVESYAITYMIFFSVTLIEPSISDLNKTGKLTSCGIYRGRVDVQSYVPVTCRLNRWHTLPYLLTRCLRYNWFEVLSNTSPGELRHRRLILSCCRQGTWFL